MVHRRFLNTKCGHPLSQQSQLGYVVFSNSHMKILHMGILAQDIPLLILFLAHIPLNLATRFVHT